MSMVGSTWGEGGPARSHERNLALTQRQWAIIVACLQRVAAAGRAQLLSEDAQLLSEDDAKTIDETEELARYLMARFAGI